MNEQTSTELETVRPSLEGRFFHYLMAWRIIYGTFRLVFGISMLFLVGTPLSDLLSTIMSHELTQDPNDVLVNFVHSVLSVQGYVVTYFLAGYFVFWGTIDVFLSANLLRDKLWAFPVTISLVIAFLLYELFRFTHTHSLILAVTIAMDIVTVLIIRRHYLRLKRGP